MRVSPTTEADCVACGCSACTATGKCYSSSDIGTIIKNSALVGLPKSTPGTICHRLPRALPDCDHNVLEDIMGPLAKDANGDYAPTQTQCVDLLVANWPHLEHWLNVIFPNFNPPTTFVTVSISRSVLKLWIQQFHPSSIVNNPDWTHLVNTLNAPAADWVHYFAWGGADPGYTTDDGATFKSFPPQLQAYLVSVCATEGCNDINVLNAASQVCWVQLCLIPAKCALVNSAFPCVR